MVSLPLALTLLLLAPSDDAPPVNSMSVHTLDVKYWQGSFGSFMFPAAGSTIRVDLSKVGTNQLLAAFPAATEDSKPSPAPLGFWPLSHLKVSTDVTKGDDTRGWTRRVVLKGRRPGSGKNSEQTVLELTIMYEVERFEEQDGRRVKLTSNMTHVMFTLHTLLADDTIREYGRATRSYSRD
ncbi:MAG: hypothetical protein AAF581_19070 [Planctomycetota bacterium]